MVAPDARPGGDPPSAYADLGRWLARAIAPGKSRLRAVEAAGREIGRDLAPQGGGLSAEETMQATLVSLGFQPEREVDPTGTLNYKLCNCPYRDVVRENQPVVCTLHRGITRGLLDSFPPRRGSSDSSRVTPTPPAASSSCAARWPTKRSRRPQRRGSPTSRDNAACREHGGARRDPRRACHALARPGPAHDEARPRPRHASARPPPGALSRPHAQTRDRRDGKRWSRSVRGVWEEHGREHFRLEEEILLPAYAHHGDPALGSGRVKRERIYRRAVALLSAPMVVGRPWVSSRDGAGTVGSSSRAASAASRCQP